jgi:endonuclease YncB( thermonuclease family)
LQVQYDTKQNLEAYIDRFADGDTVIVFTLCRCCRGAGHRILRIPFIESWEIKSPQRHRAIHATATLNAHFRGTRGILTGSGSQRDNYGRTVSDILIGDELLSNMIVAMGLAWYGVGTPCPREMQ